MSNIVSTNNFENHLKQLINNFSSHRTKPLKLIIHAGTPKTGTTSLQAYLDKKQRKLHKLGILYPTRSHNPDAPKHQWLEKNLVRTHPQNLLDNFASVVQQVDENTHTVLLSSEGVYNHWWDFPEESTILLKAISSCFEVNIWVWFREPLAFAESFYKQCMRNPAVKNIPCYGKDLSFAEILQDSWFIQRLDYLSFVNDCDALFGKSAVSVFEYQKDTVKTVSELLGLATPHDNPTPRKNTSMNAITSELYRVINRLQLTAKEKEKLVPHLHDIDSVLRPYANKLSNQIIDRESRIKIENLTAVAMTKLKERYFK